MNSNEIALCAKFGDAAAIAELWSDCVNLVKSICNKYQPNLAHGNRQCDWNNLIQSSYIAFRKCLDKWEPRETSQFTTYLTYYVKEACRLEVGSIVRKGVKMDMLPFTSSYDVPMGDREDGDTFLELIVDESALQDFEQVKIRDMQRLVRTEVNRLPDMERRIIILHHFKGIFISQIAEILGVAKNTVVNHERSAFATLRQSKTLQSLYIEFVSTDIEVDRTSDSVAFRLDMLNQDNAITMLHALFDEDALEIFR